MTDSAPEPTLEEDWDRAFHVLMARTVLDAKWFADVVGVNESFFRERWGMLPRKSPLMLSVLAMLVTGA